MTTVHTNQDIVSLIPRRDPIEELQERVQQLESQLLALRLMAADGVLLADKLAELVPAEAMTDMLKQSLLNTDANAQAINLFVGNSFFENYTHYMATI